MVSTSHIHSFPGSDDTLRVQLDNGITILARANFNSPSIAINGYIAAASILDPTEKLGLADFTSAALMRGTSQRTFQEIYETLESAGASLGFDCGTHTTSFGGKALAEDLDMLLELLAETLRHPTFPVEQVERLRAQLLTGLAIRAQDTSEMASQAFDQIVYHNHPYERPEDGYPETIQAIQPDDLAQFHRQNYGPQGMTLVIAGAVDPQQAVERASRFLGDWSNASQPAIPELPALTPLTETTTRRVILDGKYQSDIFMGVAGPPRRAPDYLAASLGNNILGQFGMMGRIGDVVREQAGLAYYASSSLSGGSGPGPWRVSAGVDPENVDKAIELIRQEIARFVNERVSDEELADSQANFIGRLPLSLESNGGVAGALLNLERYDLGLDYYRQYPELVRAVTADDVLQAARSYLHPDRLGIGIAGP